ncbi:MULTISPECIES: glycoside hydrolase family 15 protein [unclassified Beijerinckia]|uniref:glycoside hydrolase family 15 protein n=1 Tax=unclassified Beijerinckia TaxID=2638183 RepID=UPI0008954196|nr:MULTISPECIES: glycoside hydrolase family 15 protein [unclassified Beijerinckia]MDH7795874.1 GH15 family glucan-1,4-alpha-glucosidase [Beijerinckia sp. GAS462]SEC20187.1 Glucoamylase (glucan-1,4-alpha-glucosidase), GH15 family [Beijerinckia sp. 28-YEA-48]
MHSLDLAVIGNCSIATLIDKRARMIWSCFPRLDGDPAFCNLLMGEDADKQHDGLFEIELVGGVSCSQSYIENTAVLVSVLSDAAGNSLEITDYAPRFMQFDRIYRPPMVVRRIRPLKGRPRIRVRATPKFNWGADEPEVTRGNSHIRFVGPSMSLRLTTDAPVAYLLDRTPFVIDRPLAFFFGADEPLRAGIDVMGREFLEKTIAHWQDWVRSLSIPFDWQEAVIRSAITLKMCNFEETGAIVAALTTSIPEAPSSGRNWDYRYCWVRDAYFVIQALNRLGTTRTMETYIGYITDIVDDENSRGAKDIGPLFSVSRLSDREERIAEKLAGYRGMGPVRTGNGAYTQVQNDVYGSIVLASMHAFFDHRLVRDGNEILFERLEGLGRRALEVFNQPDAGPWELRTIASIHTFSSVMCWAACDRLARAAKRIGRDDRSEFWQKHAETIHAEIDRRAFNAKLGTFVSAFDGEDLDATLLLLAELGFVKAEDPRFVATVEAIGKSLRLGDLLLRYATHDDFGHMTNGFLICSFWYVDALAAIGHREEAVAQFERLLALRNSFGLLSEDADHQTGELWGNFPQTYSMVGLINSAVRLSRPWE